MFPKNPKWAEKLLVFQQKKSKSLQICIQTQNSTPIFNEWAGGTQKQLNGSIQLWAITALMAITKTFGLSGETFGGAWAATNSRGPVADSDSNNIYKFFINYCW